MVAVNDETESDTCWICLDSSGESPINSTRVTGLMKMFKSDNKWLKCKCSLGAHEQCLKSYILYSVKNGHAEAMNPFFITRNTMSNNMTKEETAQMDLLTEYVYDRVTNNYSAKYIEEYLSSLDADLSSLYLYGKNKRKIYRSFLNACDNFWSPNPFISTVYYFIRCPQCKVPFILKRSEFDYEYVKPLFNMLNIGVLAIASSSALLYVSQDVLMIFTEYITRYGKYCINVLAPQSIVRSREAAFKDVLNRDENVLLGIVDNFVFSMAALTQLSSSWPEIDLTAVMFNLRSHQRYIWLSSLACITYFETIHSNNPYRYLAFYSVSTLFSKLLFSVTMNPLYRKWRTLYDPSFPAEEEQPTSRTNSQESAYETRSWFKRYYYWVKTKCSQICVFFTVDYRPKKEGPLILNILELCFWPNVGRYLNEHVLMQSSTFKVFINQFSKTPDEALFIGNLVGVSLYQIAKLVVNCVFQYYEYKVMQNSQVATYESENMLCWEAETYGRLFSLTSGLPDLDSVFPYTHLFQRHFLTEAQRDQFPAYPSYKNFKSHMNYVTLFNFSKIVEGH